MNHVEKRFLRILGIVMGILFLGGLVTFMGALAPMEPSLIDSTKQKSEKSVSISNPDYLRNPSIYLVDYENKILSSFEGPLWIEEVINSNTLRVSYTIIKTGAKILKIQALSIPWLGDPAEDRSITKGMVPFLFKSHPLGQCWENGAIKYLQENFLHTQVGLVDGGSYYDFIGSFGSFRLLTTDNVDVATYVIKNGYGSVARPPTAYFLEKMIEQENKGIGPFDADTTPNYFSELTDMEGVASLAKRGLWGTCQ